MKRRGSTLETIFLLSVILFAVLQNNPAAAINPNNRYAIVLSKNVLNDPNWSKVYNALKQKHQAKPFFYKFSIAEVQEEVSRYSPFYICFIARPEEANQLFVRYCHFFVQGLDQDPYYDAVWAILTGYTAEDALRIAAHDKPLIMKNALSSFGDVWLYCDVKIRLYRLGTG